MPILRSIQMFLLACLAMAVVPHASAQAPASSSQLLASEFIRVALGRMNESPLSVEAIDAAILLANEAIALDPDNAELWTLVLDLAMLAERDDLKNTAIEKLARLLPNHEVVKLARLNARLERFPTVEQREAAYLQLLDAQRRNTLGPAIASRLALDLALLYQRQGDVRQFTQWLTEAVQMDRSNRTAAAIAAGFFRLNVNDPHAEAELLVNLLIADPTDINTQVVLAQLLLENGAFSAAERLYSLAVRSSNAAGRPPANNLIADQAIAQWARGNDAAALETLRSRASQMDQLFRFQVVQQNKELTREQINALTAPPDPTLKSIEAIIRIQRDDPEAANAVNAAIGAYRQGIAQVREYMTQAPSQQNAPAVDHAQFARVHLEVAWLMVWLGADIESVPAVLADAQMLQPISDVAMTRFDGWLAFRRGELDRAEELLRPIAEQDLAARIGLAMTLRQQGRSREAAIEFLAAHRAQPGSLMGVWSGKQLQAMINRVPPPTQTAVALEQLVASVSRQFDAAVQDTSLAITLRIRPTKLNFAAYEPVLVDIELTNNSIYPLGLDRDGPIRPLVMIIATVRGADAPGLGELAPFMINIGHRLRLMPREKLTVRVNLRNYRPGDVMNALSLNGSIIRLKGLINFAMTQQGAAVPTLYGMEVDAPLIRVDGARTDESWFTETVSMMNEPNEPGVVQRMGLISFRIAPRPPRVFTQGDREVLNSMRVSFAEAFAKLNPVSQAWLLAVMPRAIGPAIEGLMPVLAIAQKSEDRLVQMTYLLYRTVGSNDPMIDAAKRSNDAVVRALAEHVQMMLKRVEDAEAQQR